MCSRMRGRSLPPEFKRVILWWAEEISVRGQAASMPRQSLKMAGVSAVIAKSLPEFFFRNCINVGLPAVIIDTDRINEGDELEA